jgi:hypothetical protein
MSVKELPWMRSEMKAGQSSYWTTPAALEGEDLTNSVVFLYYRNYEDSEWVSVSLPKTVTRVFNAADDPYYDDPRYAHEYAFVDHEGETGSLLLWGKDDVLVVVQKPETIAAVQAKQATGDFYEGSYSDGYEHDFYDFD